MTEKTVETFAKRAFLRGVDTGEAFVPTVGHGPLARVVRMDRDSSQPVIGDGVCCMGAFDGIHRGHRFLFAQTRAEAQEKGVPSVIVTFDPDPDELFKPLSRQRKILSNPDRIEFLRRFGADYVLVVSFTPQLAALTSQQFVDDVLERFFHPVGIHVGADFRLGADNAGSVEDLTCLGDRRGFAVHGHDLRTLGDKPVSATRIRDLVQQGSVDAAADMLCRPHFVRGQVRQGRHEGTGFGFPTANVAVTDPYVMPSEGVYAGFVEVDGRAYPAAINMGAPRTFADKADDRFLEANLIGFDGDLYDRQVAVAFVHYLRPQKRFDSLDELIATVDGNIDWVREHLGDAGIPL